MIRRCIRKVRGGSPENGFTLIELLVALTILSFGLLAVASLLLTSIFMNALGRSTSDAMALARAKLENLKTLTSTDPQLNIGGSLSSDAAGYYDTVGNFKRRWQIVAGPASAQTYTVTVVPLNIDARRNKSVTLTTVF